MTARERPIVPAGPDSGPVSPLPLRVCGPVVKGFGRGSKELQIPTANIPIEGLNVGGCETVESGVYFGWASLDLDSLADRDIGATSHGKQPPAEVKQRDGQENVGNEALIESVQLSADGSGAEAHQAHIFPMVMSIGWNPFYKNTVRSVEVHILHDFPRDFYGVEMKLLILGYIRPELDYISKEALIQDIKIDIEIARASLQRDAYKKFMFDEYLSAFTKQ